MESRRQIQVADQIARLAAEFLERESNRESLLTVTRADISPDLARATIFFTVLPESDEERALAFARRQREEFRAFIKKKRARLKTLPQFQFEIDYGEKNRQRLDELS